jgi:2-polyprenyl-6-methoxyphenol hydroxylase-like FAD-dependent oxidoreductase
MKTVKKYGRAIVIGASMGGLLAARALSEHFCEVLVLERDELSAEPRHRRGVPQSRHSHHLLGSGLLAIEAAFPGFTAELRSRGAILADPSEMTQVYSGFTMPNAPRAEKRLLASRPLIETTVRTRLIALPNVRLRQGVAVNELTTDADRRRVTGVRVEDRHAAEAVAGAEDVLTADLVVDASGRGSRLPKWLQALGYRAPQVERVDVDAGYVTRLYRWTPDMPKSMAIGGTRDNTRLGVMLPLEDGTCMVTLAACFGEVVPTDADAFASFATKLESQAIADLLRRAEPVGEAVAARFPGSVRMRYDKLAALPVGLLPFGDVLCGFNPVYGQGMSVAALEARELDACLRESRGLEGLTQRFLTRANAVIASPWKIAANNDLRMPATRGKRTLMGRFSNWYIARLHRAAQHDVTLFFAFLDVINLTLKPEGLLTPRLAWRVLRGNLRGARVTRTPSHNAAPATQVSA